MTRPLQVEADLVLVGPGASGGEASATTSGPAGISLRGEGRTLRLVAPALRDVKALVASLPGGRSPLALLRQAAPWLARADLRVEARIGSRLVAAIEPRRRTLAGRLLRIPGLILPTRSLTLALRLRG
jgi:hypothetical protein